MLHTLYRRQSQRLSDRGFVHASLDTSRLLLSLAPQWYTVVYFSFFESNLLYGHGYNVFKKMNQHISADVPLQGVLTACDSSCLQRGLKLYFDRIPCIMTTWADGLEKMTNCDHFDLFRDYDMRWIDNFLHHYSHHYSKMY